MKCRHSHLASLRQGLALGASLLAMSAIATTVAAQEQATRPSTKIFVYNIWNKNGSSLFWKNGNHNNGFTDQMIELLRDVNPDSIVYPELGNNTGSLAGGKKYYDRFVEETLRALSDEQGKSLFKRNDDTAGIGSVMSGYDFDNLAGNRILVRPDDGFPNHIVNGVHLNYHDSPYSSRISQAQELNSFVRSELMPVISAGDFNAADVSERGLNTARNKAMVLAREITLSRNAHSDYTRQLFQQYLASETPENQTRIKDIISKWQANERWKGLFTDAEYARLSWNSIYQRIVTAIEKEDGKVGFLQDETYPVESNVPQTLNILKKDNQLFQRQKNREIFAPSRVGDGRSTWTSDGQEVENTWYSWDRGVIDHIMGSRPYAKWMLVDESDPDSGILNGRTTNQGIDPSDHEPIAQRLFWVGPNLTYDHASQHVNLGFAPETKQYDSAGEFVLSRNNQRSDVRFDNIADENGYPIYRKKPDGTNGDQQQYLNDFISRLISAGVLKAPEGYDPTNDPNFALKMGIDCNNKALFALKGVSDLCIDNHSKFNNLKIRGGVVAFEEAEALGNTTGTITLIDGGLRVAGKTDTWGQWNDRPLSTFEKPIVVEAGIGSFDVTDAGHVVSLNGTISGAGTFEKRGQGTLVLNAANHYAGGTILRDGVLRAGVQGAFGTSRRLYQTGGRLELAGTSLTLNAIRAEGGVLDVGTGSLDLELDRDALIASSLVGAGTIKKSGEGRLVINGKGSHNGLLNVISGGVVVGDQDHPDASLDSDITLQSGAMISGIGAVQSLTANGGSLIAPGNSIGQLTVKDELKIEKSARYQVELAANGASDHIAAGGKALINGGAVEAPLLDPVTSYINGQSYRILTASGGVSGLFDHVLSQSAFLDMGLLYDPNHVDLKIRVKREFGFADTAMTENQRQVAERLEQLEQSGASLALYNHLLPLSAAQSRAAYDALSGEIHASLQGALMDDSRFVRQAANQRLLTQTDAEADGLSFWANGYGAWGHTGGDGNAAKLERKSRGMFFGGDAQLTDSWHLGLFGGYGSTALDVAARDASADVDSYTVGAYAGAWFDPIGLRFGVANSWHSIDVARAVSFPNFYEALSSSYDARSLQVFGEVSSQANLGSFDIAPFAGLAYVKLDRDSYTERGAAGLHGVDDVDDATYSTLGIRFGTELTFGETKGRLKGSIAWQYAFGSTVPTADQQLVTGGLFQISGAPNAKNAALLEFGYDWSITPSTSLAVSYQGQLAADVQQHGVNAKLQVRF